MFKECNTCNKLSHCNNNNGLMCKNMYNKQYSVLQEYKSYQEDDHTVRTVYNIGQLIEILKGFEPDMRVLIPSLNTDFYIDVRRSKDLFYTVELGDENVFKEYDNPIEEEND